MSLAPRYAQSHILGNGPNVIELYLDYVCVFSAKLYKLIRHSVYPEIEKSHPGKFTFIFRHQIQPWHPSSTLVHEAAIGVGLLAPDKFWKFSDALFEHNKEYYDESVYDESRSQTYRRLSKLAHDSVGLNEPEFLRLLEIDKSGTPTNKGNALQTDVKYFVRSARQNGIHVSPTVAINGVIDNSFSSGTPADTWIEKLVQVDKTAAELPKST